jgi:hypothetical protein
VDEACEGIGILVVRSGGVNGFPIQYGVVHGTEIRAFCWFGRLWRCVAHRAGVIAFESIPQRLKPLFLGGVNGGALESA